jgi:L-ascorbate metabolism protein UlaG (beta-lactamase superfamily)
MTSTGTSFLAGSVGVRLVGGPTVLIEMGGLRLLTDPAFARHGASGQLRLLAPGESTAT